MSTALAETILTRYPDPDEIPWRHWCYMQGYVLCGFEKTLENYRRSQIVMASVFKIATPTMSTIPE